jgi:hypothetical protein
MLKLTTSHGASVRGSHPSKIAKGGGRVAQPLICLAVPTKRVPRSSRTLRRAEPRTPASEFRSRGCGLKGNLPPALIDPHRPGFIPEIEPVTAPAPFFRRFDQSALYRIAVHVSQFFDPLLRRPHVEIIEPSLPESRARNRVSKPITLACIFSLFLRQQSAGCALLQDLHHRRWTSDLWFSDQQMDVFGHDHVSHHHKAVTLTGLFENGDNAVAFTRSVQKR